MLSLRAPSEQRMALFLARAAASSLTYDPPGLSALSPSGYTIDELRVRVGKGGDELARAKEHLDSWGVLRTPWSKTYSDSPPVVGANVVIAARVFGIWTVNACRVVQRFEDPDRYGFAYGTLADHVETGEEFFALERDPDETVWYHIRAVSKARALSARVAGPVAVRLQRKFREDSARAMQTAIAK